MLYFIILTQKCNLTCKYCGNQPNPDIEPVEITYDIKTLKNFIQKDPEPIVAFYGGEPLLKIPLMEKIMDEIKAKHYILQTNGIFLHKLKPNYLHKLDTILVSIDGRKETTEYYRGKNTYNLIIKNVRIIRERGYGGDLIARMAVSEKTNIYEDVKHLIELKNPKFDHVHWQLDVQWDLPPYQRYKNFDEWAKRYNKGITKLVKYWIQKMEKEEKVQGIVPFIGIMKTLLNNEKTELRCGAGINSFTITTSGKIIACPIAPEFEWNNIGNIWNSKPEDLPYKVTIGEPCLTCNIYSICGGRCLFANKTKLWGIQGFKKVCNITRHLIRELEKTKPTIEKLIKRGIIKQEEFNYPPYNNTTEIIP